MMLLPVASGAVVALTTDVVCSIRSMIVVATSTGPEREDVSDSLCNDNNDHKFSFHHDVQCHEAA